MTTEFEIELRPLREYQGGPCPIAYWCKGHVDLAQFAAVARHEYVVPPNVQPRHTLWRCVPVGERGYWCYHEAKASGRGVFAVTVIECY